jgi:ubiquitin-protein ligase
MAKLSDTSHRSRNEIKAFTITLGLHEDGIGTAGWMQPSSYPSSSPLIQFQPPVRDIQIACQELVCCHQVKHMGTVNTPASIQLV